MAYLTYKIEEEVAIRESASDFFHDILLNRPHHVSNVHPELVQGCDLHEGEFGTIGSIIAWDYTLDGKPQTLKQEIMEVDEKNKMMKFKVVGGELADEYPTIYCTFKVIPKDNESSIVKWIFDYEKNEADGRDPSKEMHALIELTKKIDDHHHGEARTLKQEILEIDEENKMMKFKCVGGELAKEYKTHIATFKVTPKDNESSIVKWIFEYEKMEDGTREPYAEIQALFELTKKIDDYHRELN